MRGLKILSTGRNKTLRSLLLLALIDFPLWLGVFLCLQTDVRMKHMQENDFHGTKIQWCHHAIIVGCIDTQEFSLRKIEPASYHRLLQHSRLRRPSWRLWLSRLLRRSC